MNKIGFLLVLIIALFFLFSCNPYGDCIKGDSGNYNMGVYNSNIYINYDKQPQAEWSCDLSELSTTKNESQINNIDYDPVMERLIKAKVRSGSHLIDENTTKNYVSSTRANPPTDAELIVNVTTREFKLSYHDTSSSTFKLVQKRDHCYVWIDIDDIGKIPNEDTGEGISLEGYADYFNDHSWNYITENIHKPTEWFGWPTDHINIVFFETKPCVAGFFSRSDFYAGSNEANIIYIDVVSATEQGVISNNPYITYNPLFTRGTLTHEFQHLVNAQYALFENDGKFPDSWINELCSSSAETLWSEQAHIYIPYFNQKGTGDGTTTVIRWGDEPEGIGFSEYAVAALFGTYLVYQTDPTNYSKFYKTLYLNYNHNSLYDLIKTMVDNGIYTEIIDFSDINSVKTAWNKIFGNFISAIILNEPTGDYGFNGAWTDLNPCKELSIPKSPLKAYSLEPSSFIAIETKNNILNENNNIRYKAFLK